MPAATASTITFPTGAVLTTTSGSVRSLLRCFTSRWDCDIAKKGDKYYLYFPAKDKTHIFRCGVAVADSPVGPFIPQPDPIRGSYSIDYCILEDKGEYYFYFGGIWGGQLQRYRNNDAIEPIKGTADV